MIAIARKWSVYGDGITGSFEEFWGIVQNTRKQESMYKLYLEVRALLPHLPIMAHRHGDTPGAPGRMEIFFDGDADDWRSVVSPTSTTKSHTSTTTAKSSSVRSGTPTQAATWTSSKSITSNPKGSPQAFSTCTTSGRQSTSTTRSSRSALCAASPTTVATATTPR